MSEQIQAPIKSTEASVQDFETQLLVVKAAIQIRLVEEFFGTQSEETNKIITWISKYGSTINNILHQNPSLLEEFSSNPDGVLNTIKKELGD